MISNRIVTVIPTRAGSKGVINKNIREINGQPLIAYSILDSLQTPDIEETFVSTDSTEIANVALRYGARVPFLRPIEFAKDDSLDLQWALHFLKWFNEQNMCYPEYIIHLRATTPFRHHMDIFDAILTLKDHPEATALVSVEEEPETYKTFKINGKYLDPVFDMKYHLMPRQKCPKTYLPNGYVDILKTSTLLKKSFHGDKILPYITPKVMEIDTEDDLWLAEMKALEY